MNAKDAYTLLETLMDGVNPVTGEMLPADHVCQEPAVLRALHKALTALQRSDDAPVDETAMVNRNGQLNAGRPWTQKDLDWLKQLHEAGASMEEMCHLLQRRRRGIERQLVFLGLVEKPDDRGGATPGRARTGTPWLPEDDQTLRDLWAQGESKERIARVLQRSTYAIHCRLERLGLLNQEDADEQLTLPPWSLEEVQLLKRLHASGCTAEEIAAQMRYSVESIRARMFYMGMTKEAPVSLRTKRTP